MKKLLIPAIMLLSAGQALAQSQANPERMLGCWKTASDAQEHILLTRDRNFVFSDYNSKTGTYETMTGTWDVVKRLNHLVLKYDDRPKQTFTIKIDGKGNYKLTKAGGFEFIKGQPSECK